MREIVEKMPVLGSWRGKLIPVGLLAAAAGVAVGSLLFPSVEIKIVERRVEVPVEVVKYVDRVVEKVVEKRVEVPVEVIKYVDRIVEKRIEIPVERVVERRVEVPVVRRVEVPVEKIVYRDKVSAEKPRGFFSSPSSWADLSVGMSREQVIRILGRPRSAEGDGVSIIESWFYGSSTKYGAPASVRFGEDGVIGWDSP
jgi:hypothetical protein